MVDWEVFLECVASSYWSSIYVIDRFLGDKEGEGKMSAYSDFDDNNFISSF